MVRLDPMTSEAFDQNDQFIGHYFVVDNVTYIMPKDR